MSSPRTVWVVWIEYSPYGTFVTRTNLDSAFAVASHAARHAHALQARVMRGLYVRVDRMKGDELLASVLVGAQSVEALNRVLVWEGRPEQANIKKTHNQHTA